MTDIQVDKAKARQTDAQRSVPEAVAMAMCAPGGLNWSERHCSFQRSSRCEAGFRQTAHEGNVNDLSDLFTYQTEGSRSPLARFWKKIIIKRFPKLWYIKQDCSESQAKHRFQTLVFAAHCCFLRYRSHVACLGESTSSWSQNPGTCTRVSASVSKCRSRSLRGFPPGWFEVRAQEGALRVWELPGGGRDPSEGSQSSCAHLASSLKRRTEGGRRDIMGYNRQRSRDNWLLVVCGHKHLSTLMFIQSVISTKSTLLQNIEYLHVAVYV